MDFEFVQVALCAFLGEHKQRNWLGSQFREDWYGREIFLSKRQKGYNKLSLLLLLFMNLFPNQVLDICGVPN